MKKIFYTEGPDKRSLIDVGEFIKGVPREVEDSVAETLIKRRIFKYWEEPVVETVFVDRTLKKKKVDEYNISEEG